MARARSQSSTPDGLSAGREPIAVAPSTEEAERLWRKLAQLAVEFGSEADWCLIGGLMVQLYAYEHGADSRPTSDIDVLADARGRPSMTERIAAILTALGGELSLPPRTDERIGYRFDVQGETVEVLGPDGLREHPRTLGSFETIMVKGGTQALRRTEKVLVSIAGAEPVIVRRPTLLGAILIKARALTAVRNKSAEHRQDLVRLLSFVRDPRGLAKSGNLSAKERRWLRAVEEDLAFDDPALLELFPALEVQRARQAFALLAG